MCRVNQLHTVMGNHPEAAGMQLGSLSSLSYHSHVCRSDTDGTHKLCLPSAIRIEGKIVYCFFDSQAKSSGSEAQCPPSTRHH